METIMSTNTVKAKPENIGLIVLGGAATKITSRKPLPSNVKLLYIDTSATESKYAKEPINVVRTESGLSGSGGDRGKNIAAMKQQVPNIIDGFLVKNEVKICAVILSSGGGSGSSLAFVVLGELLKAKKSTVVFLSNTTNSLQRCFNAVATVTSFNNLAKKNEVALGLFPYDTTLFSDFKEADNILIKDLNAFIEMFNTTNIGVDDSDRRVMLNPMLGVKDVVAPGVKFGQIISDREYDSTLPSICTLTYVPEGANDDIGSNAINIFSGVLTENLEPFTEGSDAISILYSDGRLPTWTADLNDKVNKFKRSHEVLIESQSSEITAENSINSSVADDGFVS
jgi:hypothetical protein